MNSYIDVVTDGLRHASHLGFPTLNIPLNEPNLSGIFAGTVVSGGMTYNAALYADQERNILEAHLLEFEGELPEKKITITPLKKIRDKEVFDSEKDLKAAIEKDIQKIQDFFSK